MTSPESTVGPLTAETWDDYPDETSQTRTIEAYPVEPADGRSPGPDTTMTGIASAFIAAGLAECARPRKDLPIMRYELP